MIQKDKGEKEGFIFFKKIFRWAATVVGFFGVHLSLSGDRERRQRRILADRPSPLSLEKAGLAANGNPSPKKPDNDDDDNREATGERDAKKTPWEKMVENKRGKKGKKTTGDKRGAGACACKAPTGQRWSAPQSVVVFFFFFARPIFFDYYICDGPARPTGGDDRASQRASQSDGAGDGRPSRRAQRTRSGCARQGGRRQDGISRRARPCASPSVLAAFMAPSGAACAAPALRFVGSTTHRRAHAGRRALLGAESRGLRDSAKAAPDGPMPMTTGDSGQERGPAAVASQFRVDDDTPTDVVGVKRTRDAADGDDTGWMRDSALDARPRRRFAAVTGDGADDEGRRSDAGRAERLQHKLAAAAALPEPGLVLQAMARLQTLCTPEETRALVARSYANAVPTPLADNGDDGNGVPGPRAPVAFVEWFGLHHAAYGLDDTPDFVWNTKVPPRSPRDDDPWSQAYWLAGNAEFQPSP